MKSKYKQMFIVVILPLILILITGNILNRLYEDKDVENALSVDKDLKGFLPEIKIGLDNYIKENKGLVPENVQTSFVHWAVLPSLPGEDH